MSENQGRVVVRGRERVFVKSSVIPLVSFCLFAFFYLICKSSLKDLGLKLLFDWGVFLLGHKNSFETK